MGVWVGIERGLGAIQARDEREADRRLKEEALAEDKRRWEADHKLNVLSAIQKMSALRNPEGVGKDPSGKPRETVNEDLVIKEGKALGVSPEVLADNIAKYGYAGAYEKLKVTRGAAEEFRSSPNQLDVDSFFDSVPLAKIEGKDYDHRQALKDLGYGEDYFADSTYGDLLDKSLSVPDSFKAVEPIYAEPVTAQDRKQIEEAQLSAANAELWNIVTDLRERENSLPVGSEERKSIIEERTALEKALDSEGGARLPTILRMLDEEQKARIWGGVQEVNEMYTAPSLRGFEVQPIERLPMDPVRELDTSGTLTPPPTAMPTETGRTTSSGRPVWRDPETGESYSEKTVTIQGKNGKWYNVPSVGPEGEIEEDQGVLEQTYGENEYTDPITGEKLEGHESVEAAEKAAQERSDSLLPTETGVSEINGLKSFTDMEVARQWMIDNPGEISIGDSIVVNGVVGPVNSLPRQTPTQPETPAADTPTRSRGDRIVREPKPEFEQQGSRGRADSRPDDPRAEELRKEVRRAERAYKWDWSKGKKGNPEKLKKLEEAEQKLEAYLKGELSLENEPTRTRGSRDRGRN